MNICNLLHGRAKIEEAKEIGRWGTAVSPSITDEQIDALTALLREHETACTNFLAMSPFR